MLSASLNKTFPSFYAFTFFSHPIADLFFMLGVSLNIHSFLPSFLRLQGNEDYVGIAARDTANALKELTSAVRGVAATSQDPDVQQAVIASAHEVLLQSVRLLDEAKQAMSDPSNPDNQQRLTQVSGSV